MLCLFFNRKSLIALSIVFVACISATNSKVAIASSLAETKAAFYLGCIQGSIPGPRHYEKLREAHEAYGLRGVAAERHSRWVLSLLTEPDLRHRLCTEGFEIYINQPKAFADLEKIDSQMRPLEIQSLVAPFQNLTQRWFANGLNRVRSDLLKPYFKYTEAVLTILPSSKCRSMLLGQTDLQGSTIAMEVANFVPSKVADEYLDLVMVAIKADTEAVLPITRLSPSQIETANNAIGDYFGAFLLTRYTVDEALAYANAIAYPNQNNLTDQEFCEAHRLYYQALAEMPDYEGGLARKLVINQFLM